MKTAEKQIKLTKLIVLLIKPDESKLTFSFMAFKKNSRDNEKVNYYEIILTTYLSTSSNVLSLKQSDIHLLLTILISGFNEATRSL